MANEVTSTKVSLEHSGVKCLVFQSRDAYIVEAINYVPASMIVRSGWRWKILTHYSDGDTHKAHETGLPTLFMDQWAPVSLEQLKELPQTDAVKVLAMKLVLAGE